MAASFINLQQPDGSWAKALTDYDSGTGVHTLVVTGSGGGGIGTVTSGGLCPAERRA